MKQCNCLLLLFLALTNAVIAADAPKGVMDSPFKACKHVIVVDKEKYKQNDKEWKKFEKTCTQKIILTDDFGVASVGSLQEGLNYFNFTTSVANKVIENLDKSKKYSDCSAVCFTGAESCSADLSVDKKIVNCSDRKKEIKNGLNVNTRKIRMELALATDTSGLLNVNIRNVNQVSADKFINSDLRDFEVGPNPVGRNNLTEREMKEALRRLEVERNKISKQFKESGSNNPNWMAIKLMERFEEHQKRYRQLIYEEAPIFAVIDSPKKFDDRNDPVWSDDQIAKAFRKLSENALKTKKKVNLSLSSGKLEFNRYNFEALNKWMSDEHDLLFYIGMKNQVEEVLKKDPSQCGVATTLFNRFNSKNLQNAGLTFAGSLVSLGVVKAATTGATNVFRIGRALSGTEAAGLTGLAIGSAYLGDSFRQYNSAVEKATSRSGLSDKEGNAIVSSEKVSDARSNVKLAIALQPLDFIGWGAGKVLYHSLAKQMANDLPEVSTLANRAKVNEFSRDQLVDKWLGLKIKNALKRGSLKSGDEELIKTKEGKEIFNKLVIDIEKSDKDFFANPENLDFFLKTAIAQIKKEKGDPSDLGDKAKSLLKILNRDALAGGTDPVAKKGLLEVYDSAVLELRESFKKDPATYAKFNTDKDAQVKVLMGAMRRLGLVNEQDVKLAAQCTLSGRR